MTLLLLLPILTLDGEGLSKLGDRSVATNYDEAESMKAN